MAWATPQYTKTQIDQAGIVLVAEVPDNTEYLWFDEFDSALVKINNWRSSHSFPLNTFQVGLREKGRQVTANCLVAQRIKRLSSIALKLRRFTTMKLSQMQDIGGCRAIVDNVAQVRKLVDLYKKSGIKHRLDHIDDYIGKPQKSGYRGIHLIYRYYSDRKTTYNSLKIEVQIRSSLQHAWATAVETVGTFIKQALKSSQGEEQWLRFFALMGTAIAYRERTAAVPNTPTKKAELRRELKELATKLDVEHRLRTYGAALQTLEQPSTKNAHYYLLRLDPAQHQVTVTGYKFNELEKASQEYLAVEKDIKNQVGSDAVLVSVESLDSLRRAYPNYFFDTNVFIEAVNWALR
jgi:Region found in RelA / SpoT proteins